MRLQIRPTGGHNDSVPPYGIKPNQLANAKNWRTYNGELRTAKGYITSTSSVISTGITAVRGLDWAVRADGTEDLVGASGYGYWRIVGDTKTIIPVPTSRGTVTAVSGTSVSGDSDTRFLHDCSGRSTPGEVWFFMTADGVAEAVKIDSRPAEDLLVLDSSYGGATTAGAYSLWYRVADAATRMAFWNDTWFFANGADLLGQWDGTAWRDVGFEPATAAIPNLALVTAVTATGGSLPAGTYWYKLGQQDADGNYAPIIADGSETVYDVMSATVVANSQISFYMPASYTDVGSWWEARNRPWTTYARIYRSSAASSGPYNYLKAIAVAGVTAVNDDGSVTLSTTDTTPVNNTRVSAGCEDLAVFDNRLCAVSGRKLYISGLPPTDVHTLAAGRLEPHYWPTTPKRVGDGEETGTLTLLVLRGELFLVGSGNVWKVARTSDDPETWPVYRFLPGVGCISRASMAKGGEWVYFLAKINGKLTVARFNGRNVQDIGTPVDTILQGIDSTKYAEAVGGVSHGFYWLTIPAGTYKTVEFNIREGSWCWRDWQMQAFARSTDEAYIALNDGVIYKPENGYDKDTAAQDYSVDTAGLHMGASEWPVRFLSTQVEFDVYAGSPDVSASRIVDEGTPAAVPGSPFAVSATPMVRTALVRDAYGQRMQLRLHATGTGLDVAVREVTLKGEPEAQDMS
jgi:hypothetical protein